MTRDDKSNFRKFFNDAWSTDETIEQFLRRAGLAPPDLFRIAGSRTLMRLRRRWFGGMAHTRELELQRAALEAARQFTKFIAGRNAEFTELSRKTCGDVIKLAREREAYEAETELKTPPAEAEPADAGVSRELTKAERIAILEQMLASAKRP
jgi:hypothetical protein